jgi:50S ribosomal subunit-associated GTPase HflX
VAGLDAVIVGFFSAKQKDHVGLMEEFSQRVTRLGARVVGSFTQRRGVSDGGVRYMNVPFSSRTVIRQGKVEAIAAFCRETKVDAVIFLNTLTDHQREVLGEAFGRLVIDASQLGRAADGS